MSIFIISLTTVFLLTIVGCNNEAADSKEQMKGAVPLGSEITLEGELPSLLTEGLSPEEKAKLTEEILPMASPDDPTPEEKFEELREKAKNGIKNKKSSSLFMIIHFNFFENMKNNRLYMFFHRLMDVISATIGICFGVLVLPLILVGNMLGNKGALFYTQERVGKNGMSFKILKFRTMIKHAEKEGIQWAKKGDSRVTKFGRFLRNSRIDEIPQFYNILKGEMSVIGPRPERPHFVEKLVVEVPFYEARHTIKPGLSGWAQVNSRYGDSMADSLEKLQYDLYYIKHRGIFLDINIIIKTIGTVLYYRGQ